MRLTVPTILLGFMLLALSGAAADAPAKGCTDVEYPPQESSLYVLPYEVGGRHNVRQGNCNEFSTHNERFQGRFAYDFEMPIGTAVVAARDGQVIFARDMGPARSGPRPGP